MKKLEVNENCIGCGMCIAIDNEHFDFQDNLSHVISNENLESDNLKNAIASCPVGAINVIEDANNETDNKNPRLKDVVFGKGL